MHISLNQTRPILSPRSSGSHPPHGKQQAAKEEENEILTSSVKEFWLALPTGHFIAVFG